MKYILQHAREPVSCLTHAWGAVLALAATVAMVLRTTGHTNDSVVPLMSALVFGGAMIALYSTSAVYHYANRSRSEIAILRRLDHSMIYVLIAGTYTPVYLGFLPGAKGAAFTAIVWALAILGILVKLCWFQAPRWLSTLFYIALGWSIVLDLPDLMAMPLPCFGLLLSGGLSYTVGAVIYIVKKPNLFARLGFHELFHLFVLLGTALHFTAVYLYMLL